MTQAIVDFNQAIRLAPQFAEAYHGRAWLWATCPDATDSGRQASHRIGREGVSRSRNGSRMLRFDTLAAACAEAGDFDGGGEFAVEGDRIAQRRSRQGQLPRTSQSLPGEEALPGVQTLTVPLRSPLDRPGMNLLEPSLRLRRHFRGARKGDARRRSTSRPSGRLINRYIPSSPVWSVEKARINQY